MLHIVQGPDRGMRFELPSNEPQLIGRSSEALPLTDKSVSRRHAELTPDDGRWLVRDLDSANGTFVNGQQIHQRVELRPGDQIRCGSTLMIFAPGSDTDERPSSVLMLEGEAFDLSIDKRIDADDDPGGDSMILASPDPVKAAMEHLRVIYELTALTSLSLEQNELLERMMDLIFDVFQPDRGFILFQKSRREHPTPAAVRYRERPKRIEEGQIPVSQTIIQYVLGQGEGILSTNAMNDQRFRAGDSVQAYGIRSAICVPIPASGPPAGEIYGVIHIDSSIANFTFTEAQLQLLRAIGQHTGLALRGLELVDAKMRNERLAAVGQTVASLSHAIKNILQGLRGGADAVELALNRGDLELASEGWPILARNLDRIYALTLNMLAYSKQQQLDIELTQVSALIEDVAQLLTPQCDQKGIALVLELSEDMPPIPVDPGAIHQVLMNLLTNAVEAIEGAHPRRTGSRRSAAGVITVRSAFDAEANEARISVADNGPGIEPAMLDRVFEAFMTTRGQRGTGLGLAVSKKIVEAHGGRLELASEPSKGSTFTVVLPSDRGGDDDMMDTKQPRPISTGELDDAF